MSRRKGTEAAAANPELSSTAPPLAWNSSSETVSKVEIWCPGWREVPSLSENGNKTGINYLDCDANIVDGAIHEAGKQFQRLIEPSVWFQRHQEAL